MVYPHVIRLGRPWQRCQFEGAVRHRRGFHCPTGLDDREEVWVVVEDVSLPAEVRCNGQLLGQVAGAGCRGEFNLTSCLAPRNELVIDVAGDVQAGERQPFGAVRLEIRLGPAPSGSA